MLSGSNKCGLLDRLSRFGYKTGMRSCQWLTRLMFCALAALAVTRADLGAQLQDHQYSSTDIGTGLRLY